jgi:hypothetical protein
MHITHISSSVRNLAQFLLEYFFNTHFNVRWSNAEWVLQVVLSELGPYFWFNVLNAGEKLLADIGAAKSDIMNRAWDRMAGNFPFSMYLE